MKHVIIHNVLTTLIVFGSAVALTIYFNDGRWMWLTLLSLLLSMSYKSYK